MEDNVQHTHSAPSTPSRANIASESSFAQSFRETLSTYKYVSPKKHTTQLQSLIKDDSGIPTQTSGFDYRDNTPSTPSKRSASDHEEFITPRTPKRSRTRSVEPSTPHSNKKRPKRGYAPPETYEHLHHLQDYLEPHLDVVFCGINPGYKSAETGCHYAHSTNHFWQTLHLSGLTDRQLSPAEAHVLLEQYKFGLTNLVDRPTAEQSELSPDEMRRSVPVLVDKIAKYRPRILCFMGKGIWDIFRQQAFKLESSNRSSISSLNDKMRDGKGASRPSSQPAGSLVKSKYFAAPEVPAQSGSLDSSPQVSQGKPVKKSFACGLQPFKIIHRQVTDKPTLVSETLIFVVPSPSARVVAYQWWDKVEFFKRLRDHIPLANEGAIDTSSFMVLPLTTTKSIYFMAP